MVDHLTIRAGDMQRIIDHVLGLLPFEGCGLIGGRQGCAELVIPVNNASTSPRNSFLMERQDMVDAIMHFQREGLEVVGIYHSHPDEAPHPSDSDIVQASWPDAIYLIIGLVNPDEPQVLAWTIRYGSAYRADLIIEE